MKKRIVGALFVLSICVCMTLVSCNGDTNTSSGSYEDVEKDDIGAKKQDEKPLKNTENDKKNPETVEEEKPGNWTATKMGSITCNGISAGNSMDNAIVYELGGKYGVLDNNGDARIEPQYHSVGVHDGKYCSVRNSYSESTRTINMDNGTVLFEGGAVYSNGYILSGISGTVYDLGSEEELITCELPEGQFFRFFVTDTSIYIARGYSYSYPERYAGLNIYNKNGDLIYSVEELDSFSFDEEKQQPIYWKKDGIYYIEVNGRVYSETELEKDGMYKVNFAKINKENKMYVFEDSQTRNEGVMTLSGEIFVPAEYDWCGIKENGFVKVRNDDNYYGMYNNNGEMIINCIYDGISDFFVEGMIGIRMGDYWGIADESGNIVYPTQISKGDSSVTASKMPAFLINDNQVINVDTGEIRTYSAIDYENYPEGLFMYTKSNGATGLSTYKEELIEFENAEIFCTKDKKVAIVKQYNEYTFYKLEKK